jgi:hypothetical protein
MGLNVNDMIPKGAYIGLNVHVVDVWTTSGRHSLKIIINNIIIIDY